MKQLELTEAVEAAEEWVAGGNRMWRLQRFSGEDVLVELRGFERDRAYYFHRATTPAKALNAALKKARERND